MHQSHMAIKDTVSAVCLFACLSVREIFYLFLILFGVRLPCCGSHAWLDVFDVFVPRFYFLLFSFSFLFLFRPYWQRSKRFDYAALKVKRCRLGPATFAFFCFRWAKSRGNKSKQDFLSLWVSGLRMQYTDWKGQWLDLLLRIDQIYAVIEW